MPFFCRSGHPVCTSGASVLICLGLLGRDLQEVARGKKSTAGGLDGWAWNEIKALPTPLVLWFGYLA